MQTISYEPSVFDTFDRFNQEIELNQLNQQYYLTEAFWWLLPIQLNKYSSSCGPQSLSLSPNRA